MLSKMSNLRVEDKKKEEEDRKRREEKRDRLLKATKEETERLEYYQREVLDEHVMMCLPQKGDFILRVIEYEVRRNPKRNAYIEMDAYATVNSMYGIVSLPIMAIESTEGIISFSFDKKTEASTIKDLLNKHIGGIKIEYENPPCTINPRQYSRNYRSITIALLNPISKKTWEFYRKQGELIKKQGEGAFGETLQLRRDQIELLKKLGEGAFGEVHLGKLIIRMGEEKNVLNAAIKVIKKTTNNEKATTELQKEGALMRKFNHQNVVRTFGMVIERDTIMVVMELINGRGLNEYVKRNIVSMEEKGSYAIDIANGLAYIHSLNCIHRDIACRNCLIDISRKQAKVSHFGLTRQTETYKIQPTDRIPIRWTAPEVLKTYQYNRAADIYAYGILVWEIFANGAIPFGILTNQQIKEGIQGTLRPEWPPGTPIGVIEAGDAGSRPQLDGIRKRMGIDWSIGEENGLRDNIKFNRRPFGVDITQED